MRTVVVDTSGAGKTTLARRIAAQLQLPHIELEAINWQSEWRDLTRHDPEEFVRRVTEAIQAEAYRRRGRVSARRHCPEFEEAGPVPVSAIIDQPLSSLTERSEPPRPPINHRRVIHSLVHSSFAARGSRHDGVAIPRINMASGFVLLRDP